MLWALRALWSRATADVTRELGNLEDRILMVLADIWFHEHRRSSSTEETMKLTRMLVSEGRHWVVTGTQDQIDKSSAKLARLTRRCVTVCVIVGHYHRRSCDDRPRGGYTPEGN